MDSQSLYHTIPSATPTRTTCAHPPFLVPLSLSLIILLETYHMVDTCDPSIAGWSEDGETFVVKDPVKFEKEIIPQFFKHSKFSSFVRVSTIRYLIYVHGLRQFRGAWQGADQKVKPENNDSSSDQALAQSEFLPSALSFMWYLIYFLTLASSFLFSYTQQLNFYAFRKIKFCDTIRIDPKLEAETANFWRFKHEKFLKGRPDLLGEIKRMNGPKQNAKPAAGASSSNSSSAAGAAAAEKENSVLKSEVSTLKQRIEDMSKNIDELTNMVKKVTVSPPPAAPVAATPKQEPIVLFREQEQISLINNKRKKLDQPSPELLPLVPDKTVSTTTTAAMDLEEDQIPSPPSFPSPMRHTLEREESDITNDEGFVDELFSTFKTDDFKFDDISSATPRSNTASRATENRPEPELMERLSEALAMLPREIQEMIVDRLIQAITAPKKVQEHIANASTCLDDVVASAKKASLPPLAVPQSPHIGLDEEGEDSSSSSDNEEQDAKVAKPTEVELNLAAATLAALLSKYGKIPKSSSKRQAHKSLPVIPVHA